ncbi:hypothetical protein [Endozoicomonas arenosclerae]|uniref:hypothetical protein n=1 Tax=Endozoicomonas arenosclerae TaxID=1633495 RepID=UPI000785B898|nr:hypothetical protein [Endozoicomonas arenosclerae]
MEGRWNYKKGQVVFLFSLWIFYPLWALPIFFSPTSLSEVPDNNLIVERFANRFFLQQEDSLEQVNSLDCLELEVKGIEFKTCVSVDSEPEGLCYPRNRVVIKPCDETSESQKWHYNFQKKTVHYPGYSTSMCLSRMIETLEVLPCIEATSAQLWLFDEQGRMFSAVDGQEKKSFLSLIDKSDDPAPLAYRYLESDMGERRCYKNLHTGQIVCEYESSEPDPDTKPEPKPEESEADEARTGDEPVVPEEEEEEARPEKPIPPEVITPPVEEEPVLGWEDKPEEAFWVSERVTEDLILTHDNPKVCMQVKGLDNCLSESVDKNSCYAAAPIELTTCDGQVGQIWRHDLQTKRVFNRAAGYRFCLTWGQEVLSLLPCFPGGSPSQKWYFAQGKTQASLERGQLRTMLNGIREPYSFHQALKLPSVDAKPGKKKTQSLRIRFEWLQGGCGWHPVTGYWQGEC